MKTRLVLLALIGAILLSVSSIGCKHEHVFTCEEVQFTLTAVKADAVLSNANGSITATATGGTDFQYSLNGSPFQDTGYFAGLAPYKQYRLVGRNSIGCTDTLLIDIGSLDPCKGVSVQVTTTKTDASPNLNNGKIVAKATGGNGFTYSINGGAFGKDSVFSNLAAGNYTIAAKSSAGCIGVAQVTIATLNPCVGVTVAITTTTVNPGTGLSNGSITATATGGTGFTYSLNGGTYQTSGTFSNLATGNYTITAKNSNGCTGSTTVALGSTNPCAGVTVTVTTSQVNPTTGQSNGSITATATGGTGITYSINNGAYQASGTFNNLAAGAYTITAKTSAGCLGTKSVTLTATSACTNVNIVITPTVVNVTPCITPANNGSITVAASGSTGFTYNLNGGAYQAGTTFSNLAAGSYLVGVKDANGCTQTKTTTVALVPQGPNFVQMRSLITTRCSSGSGCHMNGGSAAGYNFDSDCSIVTYWSQIQGACVTYTLKKMPISPQAILTTAEKQVITNWINAGHRYTD